MRTDGPIVRGTNQNLVDGLRSGKPMSREALEAVTLQAIDFVSDWIELYEVYIASGEVGADGSGSASEAPIIGPQAPRALLYGRIQSGKTAAMILGSALALDNGFKIVIVCTTDNVALIRQTASRFKDLHGPRVLQALREPGTPYEWDGLEDQIATAVAAEGLVIVTGKNASNLPEVLRLLNRINAPSYPVLVLDDEADAATPDTTLAARSSGKATAPMTASTIHRLMVDNDDPTQVGFSIRQSLPHSLMIQVTATPHVLLLQRAASAIRPLKTFMLEPGDGYTGGHEFFGAFDNDPAANSQPDTIVVVGDNETSVMPMREPVGLANSIDFFIVSACARAIVDRWPREGFKFLAHWSRGIDDHEVLANHIGTHLGNLRALVNHRPAELPARFAESIVELRRSIPQIPGETALMTTIANALRQNDVFRVNSKSEAPKYGPRLNFLVGGNILGRGLTIDDLLVTYYIREAKVSQLDTVWQHARMFGYRKAYFDYIRVYLPHRIGARFREIGEIENNLRKAMERGEGIVLIQLPSRTRPTRPNALEDGVPKTLPFGREQINPHRAKEDPETAMVIRKILMTAGVDIAAKDRGDRPTLVSLETIAQLLQNVEVEDEDRGLWHDGLAIALLEFYSDKMTDGCHVYVRELTSNSLRTRGRLSGVELDMIHDAAGDSPALVLLRIGEAAAPRGWYPTLVMPPGSPPFIFST